MVVYEANMQNGQLSSSDPVTVYWLEIDPAYQEANRKKNIQSDRSELNYIEKTMAYGLSSEPVAGSAGKYKVKLVAFKDRPVSVSLDASGKPKATMQIKGTECSISRIFVKAKDKMFGLPEVEHVDLTGVDANGTTVSERINPK